MQISSLLILAVGLAMDAFAVAVSDGLCWRKKGWQTGLAVALVFGLAQGLMPVLGYWGGSLFTEAVHRYEGVAALLLLGMLGCKMIWEGLEPKEEGCVPPFSPMLLAVQGVATSVDALAVGLGLAVMEAPLLLAAWLIGGVTFFLCLAGFWLGRRFGERLGHRAELWGGGILVFLGIKLFFEHTVI